MKKIESNDVFETVEGIVLFRDDLEDLIGRMRLRSLEPKISDPDTVYDSLDELHQLKGDRPKNVSISARSQEPYASVTVNLEKGKAWVTAHGSAELRSFAFELKDAVSRRVPWYHKPMDPWIWALITFFLLSATQGVIRYPVLAYSLITAALISLVILALSFVVSRVNYGVRLTRRHEGGFFTRNRDKILLLLLGSAIGAIGTILLQFLFRK